MTPQQAKERIKNLRDILRQHNYSYYVKSEPVIPDFEFDRLLEELKSLESSYPQFQSGD